LTAEYNAPFFANNIRGGGGMRKSNFKVGLLAALASLGAIAFVMLLVLLVS
jgi:hypothetical protein